MVQFGTRPNASARGHRKGSASSGRGRELGWVASGVPVDSVVLPAAALLHADATPLGLAEEPRLRQILGSLFGEDDVPILKRIVRVLLTVLDT